MLCCVAWPDEEHVVPPALDLYWFFIFSKEMSGLHSVLTPRKLGFFARRPPPEVYRSRCLPPPSKPLGATFGCVFVRVSRSFTLVSSRNWELKKCLELRVYVIACSKLFLTSGSPLVVVLILIQVFLRSFFNFFAASKNRMAIKQILVQFVTKPSFLWMIFTI